MTTKGGGKGPDERLWKPEVDKAGNGYAVIRFLPAPAKEDLPWAQVFSHAFQGPGGWYIENSLTTIGQQDPVGDLNRVLWNSGLDSDKDVARKQKRKLSYYSNIYVVKDPLHPENEGRVFLYKYGKKIHDKIEDTKLEEIYNQEYSLKDFTDSKNFKSYEELESRLNLVLGKTSRASAINEDDDGLDYEDQIAQPVEEVSTPPTSGFGNAVSSLKEEEDPDLSYFAKLAEE